MSDLISRQAVLDILQEEKSFRCGYDADIAILSIEKDVKELPTAYDVDAVVKQVHDELFCYDIPDDIVDDIVRKGGVNENNN